MPSYISSIGLAVPKNRINQKDIGAFMTRHLPLTADQRKALQVLYRASGIRYRHSVIEDYGKSTEQFQFYPRNESLTPFPDLQSRMKLYEKEALNLAVEACNNCLKKDQIESNQITHLVTVSCTGMSAPGIDIDLVGRLKLRTDIGRTSVNFMGCYAAFHGMKIANQICLNDPRAKVLLLCVELCSIHFQNTSDDDNLLSSALFADGAAAVLIQGKIESETCLEMTAFYSDLDLSAREEMSWKIGNLGFLMKLSTKVPETIRSGIKRLTQKLLEQLHLNLKDIEYFAIHPGGKKILEVIEEELGISKIDNLNAYEVLKSYGNMSSPTVLFVIDSVWSQLGKKDDKKRILSFAFGPGLTLESMLLKVHHS